MKLDQLSEMLMEQLLDQEKNVAFPFMVNFPPSSIFRGNHAWRESNLNARRAAEDINMQAAIHPFNNTFISQPVSCWTSVFFKVDD